MILQSFVDYYEALAKRGEIAAPGWCVEKVSFALNISLEGELLDIIPLTKEEQRGKKTVEVPQILEVPERVIKAGKVVKSNFLCENTGYMLGFDNKGNPERAIEYFYACKELHLLILEDSQGTAANAVKAFFKAWEPENAKEHPVLLPYLDAMSTANLIFMVDGGDFAQKDLEIRQAWQKHFTAGSDIVQMRCLVTGETAPVAVLHGKIKGVPNAQPAGANLVGFNDQAYESYGRNKSQGLNAPVSKYAAYAYVTVLNRLISDRKHRQQIGDTTMVYWAEDGAPEPQSLFTSMFAFPEPEDESILSGIMDNLAHGRPVDSIDINKRFYILGLAPNAARISVRFFLQDSFGAFLDNIRQHYMRLEIVKAPFEREYLSVPLLLAETVNPNSRDKASSPLMSGAVMRSILTGTTYPRSLYQAVLGRVRAEHKISRGKAAIIKAYLLLQPDQQDKEVLTVALNIQSNNRAYVLGRLFAVLEEAQQQANPGINATIKDRYFTSACATPGSVFPQLLKLSAYHTAKADYGYVLEAEKAKLMDKLDVENNPLPAHHTLNDQGVFILGYYHQVQARYNKNKEEK